MPPDWEKGTKAWHIENDTNEERLWGHEQGRDSLVAQKIICLRIKNIFQHHG